VDEWGRERAAELAALVEAAAPHEELSDDELLACCWDDPGVVLATPTGDGAVAAVLRTWGRRRVGFVRLLAVHPGARRLGKGRDLLAAAEHWLVAEGAEEVRWGGSAPFYLWPGVDVRATAALCLAEATGYRADGAELNLSCPTTFRAKAPEGVDVRRVLDDADVAAVLGFADEHWPHWRPELGRGVEQGGAFAALGSTGSVVGFACHSVNRAGWIGPMATDPRRGRAGIGASLLSALCQDLMVAGRRDAEIAWVGPVGFYVKTAGAAVSRVFRSYVKTDLRP
jgi:GNAT superfamily N-acetyltransferase